MAQGKDLSRERGAKATGGYNIQAMGKVIVIALVSSLVFPAAILPVCSLACLGEDLRRQGCCCDSAPAGAVGEPAWRGTPCCDGRQVLAGLAESDRAVDSRETRDGVPGSGDLASPLRGGMPTARHPAIAPCPWVTPGRASPGGPPLFLAHSSLRR
jgi:hypothetical protein